MSFSSRRRRCRCRCRQRDVEGFLAESIDRLRLHICLMRSGLCRRRRGRCPSHPHWSHWRGSPHLLASQNFSTALHTLTCRAIWPPPPSPSPSGLMQMRRCLTRSLVRQCNGLSGPRVWEFPVFSPSIPLAIHQWADQFQLPALSSSR